MASEEIQINEPVRYNGAIYLKISNIDGSTALIKNYVNGTYEEVAISLLEPLENPKPNTSPPIESLSKEELELVNKRYQIIKPLLSQLGNGKAIEEAAKSSGLGRATLYRWLKRFMQTGLKTSLISKPKGGKGIARLPDQVDKIIKENIQKNYLGHRRNITDLITTIQSECRDKKLSPPHSNTIRNRLNELSNYEKLKRRKGKQAAENKLGQKEIDVSQARFP